MTCPHAVREKQGLAPSWVQNPARAASYYSPHRHVCWCAPPTDLRAKGGEEPRRSCSQ